MTFGRRWVAVVAVLPLLAVGACAEESVPKYQPPSETPTSETSSPAPEPEPWEEKSKAGAVAFAKHWIDVFSNAMVDGDVSELRSISSPACETCRNVSERIAAVYGAGGSYETAGWEVVQADAAGKGAAATVGMRVRRGAETYWESADAPKQSNPVSWATYNAVLNWTDGGWRMQRLELVA